ncbi:MFS transporter [Terrarubrum flagellatum]|uniref:MFS transporter n=1 Tax=Terrirubrum flagellatum TaxID=2895980 RepID=UPI003144ECBE
MTTIEDDAIQRGWRALLPAVVLGMAAFLTQFDVTAVVVATPAIASDLGFGVAGYAWVMDAYSLAFTVTLLAAGALGDRYGRRLIFVAGNGVFLIASLACGFAIDGVTLWAARAAQGVGSAFVITGGIALLASTYSAPKDRVGAFALMGVISGVAMAIGPTLGGLIASWAGWRWIFLINVPFCIVAAFGAQRLVGETCDPAGRPLDWIGVALLTFALGLAIESLLAGRVALLLCSGLAASAALFVVFAIQQRRRAVPIFDPVVLGQPVMAGIVTVLLAVSIGYWAVLVYLPMFLATAAGWTGATVGAILLSATLPMLVLPPLGARLVARWGWRRLFVTAMAAVLVGDLALSFAATCAAASPMLLFATFAGMVMIGLGAALAHPQLSGAVVALAPPEQLGMASAITVIMRQGGFAIGIALMGALLGAPGDASAYAASFLVAALAAAMGLGAAQLLPPKSDLQ